MTRKRLYLTAVIARDSYDKPIQDSNGNFVISHWVHGHEKFYPVSATGDGIEYIKNKDGERYISSGNNHESMVFYRKKRGTTYELVLP